MPLIMAMIIKQMWDSFQTWRLIRDKDYNGLTNMAIDEAISHACGEEKSPTTLRLYGWKSPTVSIGYGQNAHSDIDFNFCKSAGIDVIKRPTGGRAVLHENELTFSISSSTENPLFPKNILKSHKKISEALLVGINRLGIKAELHHKSKKKLPRHPVCFYSPSMYELVVDGKKIVGCAQRRFKNSFLEHGSIPLRLNRNKISSILKDNLFSSNKNIESFYLENMAGLHELGSYFFPIDQIIKNIVAGFEDYFGISFEEGNLSTYERELVENINRLVGEAR